MKIIRISDENILKVSTLMSSIKPEWWDVEGARKQLDKGIGWYLESDKDIPKGWILCKSLKLYKTAEIECLGYDKNGVFTIGKELQALVEQSEIWAREQGYTIMRFTIGSRGLSCHEKSLSKPWEELRDLKEIDREEYNWFLSMGYIPSGILPNIYGDKNHGILLVKTL